MAISRAPHKALSAIQHAALRTIIDRYDRAVREERSRWGDESASFVAAKGVEISGIHRTLHALKTRGWIQLQYGEARGERLRRGAFGRRIGGTHKYSDTIFFVAPTSSGRETA